jgi:hypothetical protein
MYLGKVKPEVVKLLRGYKPRSFNTQDVPRSEIEVQSFFHPDTLPTIPDHFPLSDRPQIIACHYAVPHTDWASWFLTISLAPRVWKFSDTTQPEGILIEPGDVFMVNGAENHWLFPANSLLGKAFWYGAQWEIPEDPNEAPNSDMLVSFLTPLMRDWAEPDSLAKTPYYNLHPSHDFLAQK